MSIKYDIRDDRLSNYEFEGQCKTYKMAGGMSLSEIDSRRYVVWITSSYAKMLKEQKKKGGLEDNPLDNIDEGIKVGWLKNKTDTRPDSSILFVTYKKRFGYREITHDGGNLTIYIHSVKK